MQFLSLIFIVVAMRLPGQVSETRSGVQTFNISRKSTEPKPVVREIAAGLYSTTLIFLDEGPQASENPYAYRIVNGPDAGLIFNMSVNLPFCRSWYPIL